MQGCESLPGADPTPQRIVSTSLETLPQQPASLSVKQANFERSAQSDPEKSPAGRAFEGMDQLSAETLIQEVLTRNPGLAQMRAAYQAASDRYPQVTSLEDPFLGTTVAPASIGSNEVDFGYRLEVSQKIPFPGKLRIRGENALAEAQAAGNDVELMRLQLIEAAKSAFYDYYLVHRAIEVNKESLSLLDRIRKLIDVRYQNSQADQQELFQEDVEIGRQHERGFTLERMRQEAVGRINILMHRPPDEPLPSSPTDLPVADQIPDVDVLRASALAHRPDLEALRNRIGAEEASLRLANREYYPDFDLIVAYDTIMGNGPTHDLAAQVAVRVNLPVQRTRRSAAVSEAEDRVAQKQAELARLMDQVNYEVHQAYAQVQESKRIVRLYEQEVLPAAQKNVEAAQVAYTPGKIPLLSLIEAQRNYVTLQDRQYEAIADYHRRLANLERAVGGWPAPSTDGSSSTQHRATLTQQVIP